MTPTRTRKSLTVAAGMATAAALALAACSAGGAPSSTADAGSGSGAGDNSGYTLAMVTHETPGDTFWDKIKAGANQAAKNSGFTVNYSNDPDPAKQATLIQNAVDSKVDGYRRQLGCRASPIVAAAVCAVATVRRPSIELLQFRRSSPEATGWQSASRLATAVPTAPHRSSTSPP